MTLQELDFGSLYFCTISSNHDLMPICNQIRQIVVITCVIFILLRCQSVKNLIIKRITWTSKIRSIIYKTVTYWMNIYYIAIEDILNTIIIIAVINKNTNDWYIFRSGTAPIQAEKNNFISRKRMVIDWYYYVAVI